MNQKTKLYSEILLNPIGYEEIIRNFKDDYK